MPSAKPIVAARCEPEQSPQATVRVDADTELAAFAKALAHPTRVQILRLLANKEARMCSHIVDELPLAQSTVSEHLRVLRAAGLVRVDRRGPSAGYCIVPSRVRRLRQLIDAL